MADSSRPAKRIKTESPYVSIKTEDTASPCVPTPSTAFPSSGESAAKAGFAKRHWWGLLLYLSEAVAAASTTHMMMPHDDDAGADAR